MNFKKYWVKVEAEDHDIFVLMEQGVDGWEQTAIEVNKREYEPTHYEMELVNEVIADWVTEMSDD